MKKSVWIIDDDEIYQMIIKKIIERSDVFEAPEFFLCADVALKRLQEIKLFPDLILVDINMPIIDGWQFLDHLQKNFAEELKKCTVFIVSSSIAYSDKEKAENYNEVSGFITKPVSVESLQIIEEEVKKSNL